MENNINVTYTVGYISCIAFLFFKSGFALTAFGQVSDVLHAQYLEHGNYIIEDKATFNTVMGALIPIGGIIGALVTGELNRLGRRNSTMIIGAIFMVGCLMTCVFNFFFLFVGRFIQGYCIGGFTAIVPLFVCEMSPGPICGPVGVIGQLMGMSGVLIATIFGQMIPHSNEETYKTTGIWQSMLALPAIFSLGQILMFYFVFDHDTPTWYLLKKDYAGYDYAMGKQYFQFEHKEGKERLMDDKDGVPEVSELSWTQQLGWPQMRTLTVGMFIAIFHQASGMSSVAALSGEVFTKGYEGVDDEHAARIGALFMGLSGLLASFVALSVAHYVGRRNIIISGQFIMLFLLAVLCNCSRVNHYSLMMVATIVFNFAFNVSINAFIWLFLSEILGRTGLAIVGMTDAVAALFFGSFASQYFEWYTVEVVFFTLFFVQLAGMVFFSQIVKETMNKSAEERHTMYLGLPPKRPDDGKSYELKDF